MALAELDTVPMPPRIKRLPRDRRGYPVPWFVHWNGAEPDFRVIATGKIATAVRQRLCWICGVEMGRYQAFPIGPMCAVNRVTSEPPSHRECAEYALTVCPFLTRPQMHRQTKDLPEEGYKAGLPIERNPGVVCLWVTRSYRPFKCSDVMPGLRGVLFNLGEPIGVTWWREGRPATGEEVWQSIVSGLPALIETARLQKGAMVELERQLVRAAPLVPEVAGGIVDVAATFVKIAAATPAAEAQRPPRLLN